MKVVCAWCKKLMKGNPNDTEVSHGICPECEKEFNDSIERRLQINDN